MHGIVIFVAKYFIVISLLVALYVFLSLKWPGKKRFIAEAIIGGIIAIVLAKIGSHFYYNPRPFVAEHFTPYFSHAADNGFPSDHTLLASFLGFLVIRYRKNLGYVLLVVAALIGAARVIAGVHHVIDIIGAFVFAGIGVLLVHLTTRKVARSKAKSKSSL